MGLRSVAGRSLSIGALVLLMCTAPGGDARANEEPWRAGVSSQQQAQAKALFEQGREMLEDAFFTKAVEHFRASLALWDHPSTHFNISKALMNLDSAADAMRHLWAAMRHGGAPLELEQVEQIERYSTLIMQTEVAHLVVRSERAGAVTLDGAVIFQGPGRWEGLVRTGSRAIAIGPTVVTRPNAAVGRRVEVVFPKAGAPQSSERASTADDLASLQKSMVGFVVRFPSEAERKAWAQPAEVELDWKDPGDGLPQPSAGICAKAAGDLRTVCQQFEADRKAFVRLQREQAEAKQQAIQRLRELTKGGVADTLE